MLAKENINLFWASLIVEELVRNRVTFFCISPGSRSTPLTVATVRHPKTVCTLCHDERGAAFMALGYGKAGVPAALICTSGTAAANYFPAIIEASMDGVPMIILTADRPPELLETAANQTIRQQKLFGDYTRWDFTFPPPTAEISPRFVLSTIDQAVFRAVHAPAGPVHLNCMFREPLTPEPREFSVPQDPAFERWENNQASFTHYSFGQLNFDEKKASTLASVFKKTENGLVILGRLCQKYQNSAEIAYFLENLGWPVYADIASGFRLGARAWPVWDEKLLYSKKLAEQWRPETVLHIGGALVSNRVQQWLEKNPPQHYIHVHNDPRRIDPGHLVTERVHADPDLFCAALCDFIKPLVSTDRVARLGSLSHDLNLDIENELSTGVMSEPAVALLVSRLIPEHVGLFLGNSMPVRDMNTFAARDGRPVSVATNRGASGIDGNMATAVGFAYGLSSPVTMILGDVAALHDLNSLQLVKSSPPLVIIIVNNDGGGIFSFLPISKYTEVFTRWFEAPHGLSFDKAAEMFDLPYAQPQSMAEFHDVYTRSCRQEKSIIIEVKTDKKANAQLHHHLVQKCQHIIETNL